MTKFSKNMEWARPYVEAALDLIPKERLRSLGGYIVPANRRIQMYGYTNRDAGGYFDIRLCLNSPADPVPKGKLKRRKVKATYLGTALDTLAHEMAHCAEWEHTVDHMELQLRIMRRFVSVARKLRVQDTWGRVKF